MSAPRLHSCWFAVPKGPHPLEMYRRHARVLEHSARKNAPGWEIDVQQIEPDPGRKPARSGNDASFSYNTWKLAWWNQRVHQAQDGDRLLICDADMMVLRDPAPVWAFDFDVAITAKREVTRLPLNGGVVFTRVNARSRRWWKAWLDWNERLFCDGRLHNLYARTYAGMNQAALGALIENGGGRLANVLELPCRTWNCESATWKLFDRSDPPHIVHVKGAMRRTLMDPQRHPVVDTARRAIADVWLALEREAIAEGARA